MRDLIIRGAREHNLRGVDVVIPRESLTVITGVSGSGKSSLAFDTIYKEGYRRFVESLSPYARQFLGLIEKPAADAIEGLSPTLCIDQKTAGRNPRSTVGTMTEVYDYLRLLFARLGTPHCPKCGIAIEARSPGDVAERILVDFAGQMVEVLAPIVRDRKGEYREELKKLVADGYLRVRIDGVARRLDEDADDGPEEIALERYKKHTIEVVVDRLVVAREDAARLVAAVEKALLMGKGVVNVRKEGSNHRGAEEGRSEEKKKKGNRKEEADAGAGADAEAGAGAGAVTVAGAGADAEAGAGPCETYATARACRKCGRSVAEMEPRLFSFNAPQGACPRCNGLGLTWDSRLRRMPEAFRFQRAEPEICARCEGRRLNRDALAVTFRERNIADVVAATIAESAAFFDGLALTPREEAIGRAVVKEIRTRLEFLMNVGLNYLALERRAATLSGGEAQRIRLASQVGSGLRGVLYVLDEPSIGLHHRDNERLLATLKRLRDQGNTVVVVEHDLDTIRAADHVIDIGPGAGKLGGRVTFAGPPWELVEEGIHHGGTEARSSEGKENRREEKSTAAKPLRLCASARKSDSDLAQRRKDAKEDALAEADEVAGADAVASESVTARCLSGELAIAVPTVRRPREGAEIVVRGARMHNLQSIDVRIPLGRFVAVTGVSGSGKSTLIDGVLRRALERNLFSPHRRESQWLEGAAKMGSACLQSATPPMSRRRDDDDDELDDEEVARIPWDRVDGAALIDKVIEIDQDPIGRTPRSNPATYTKVFDLIRDLYAALPESRARGYKKGRFSFNVKGGRCEECGGAGANEIELQFLAPVEVVCDACEGRRFNAETLEIAFREKNIRDVLAMTVDEARAHFANLPKIRAILEAMASVGLGYVELGQTSTTLSGGEAQRVKLASELRRTATGRTLYILDEPTTGLHVADITHLLDALQRLVDRGNTVLVIEHNLDVIKVADHVIDLGPEGGAGGGRVVAEGTPEEVAATETHTGRALRGVLEDGRNHRDTEVGRSEEKKNRARKEEVVDVVVVVVVGERGAVAVAGAGAEPEAYRGIRVRGARKHNLRAVDVDIPEGSLTVVTGVSGSGKTSLAFDTLFSEGQRRYVESLSTYARRFLGRLDKAPVDRLEGLAPAIAIDQKTAPRTPRSTVATATEVYDYLRILFARVGTPHCVRCDVPLAAYTPSAAARLVVERCAGERGVLAAPLYRTGRPSAFETVRAVFSRATAFERAGYERVVVDGVAMEMAAASRHPGAVRREIDLVIDRVVVDATLRKRLAEGFEAAYGLAKGRAVFRVGDIEHAVSESLACPACGLERRGEIHPRSFSFNSHHGACRACDGLGVDWFGKVCAACRGNRLAPEPLAVKIAGKHIIDVTRFTVAEAAAFLGALALSATEQTIAVDVLREVRTRLDFLVASGLNYLTLDRAASTLSGGEAQRIRLATQVGLGLTGCLYVLDEPTVGLHPRDTARLLATLKGLRDLGNTVVVVEHDLQTIREADRLVDLGPGAGDRGGEVVFAGPPAAAQADATQAPRSQTAEFLSGRRAIALPLDRRTGRPGLTVTGARANNLKGIEAACRRGAITCVTGVSGSGKSTLVIDTIERALMLRLGMPLGGDRAGEHSVFKCDKVLRKIVAIDQSPLGRSPTSNTATYTGLFDLVRDVFARTREAKVRGYDKSRFSFNSPSGQCAACNGYGANLIEMHFLSDVWVTCDACRGRRYNDETLAVAFKGKTIADVLAMEVAVARDFFAAHRRIARILETLVDVGLGYMRLGQSAVTLSGGEAQRVKLAAELCQRTQGDTVYILDEPTTGLHLADVEKLVVILHRLADAGNAVIVIEHNLDVIKVADHVIDLGPDAGDAGGFVVAAGTPEAIARTAESHTGRYLAPLLNRAIPCHTVVDAPPSTHEEVAVP